jgi:hypothetical protein
MARRLEAVYEQGILRPLKPMIDKNVLGRTGWLDRVRLGLVHHDNKLNSPTSSRSPSGSPAWQLILLAPGRQS